MELIWITAVKVLEGHRLHLTFNNGTCKEFDFAQVLAKGQPIFEPLNNLSVFRNIALDGAHKGFILLLMFEKVIGNGVIVVRYQITQRDIFQFPFDLLHTKTVG